MEEFCSAEVRADMSAVIAVLEKPRRLEAIHPGSVLESSIHTSLGTALPHVERFVAIDCRSHDNPKPVQNISLHSPWRAEQRSALVAAVVCWRPGMFVVSQHVWSPQWLVPPTCLR